MRRVVIDADVASLSSKQRLGVRHTVIGVLRSPVARNEALPPAPACSALCRGSIAACASIPTGTFAGVTGSARMNTEVAGGWPFPESQGVPSS